MAAMIGGSAGAAHAGAWPTPVGVAKVYHSFEHATSEVSFDARGERAAGESRRVSMSVAIEYGALDWLTVGAGGEGKWLVLASVGDDGAAQGVGDIAVWARALLFEEDGWVTSTQATYGFPSEVEIGAGMPLTDGASFAELRGLVGRGVGGRLGSGWVNAEGAYRLRTDDAVDQFRFGATIGFRPEIHSRLMLIVQSSAILAAGRGDRSDFDLIDVTPSVGYEIDRSTTLQLGVSQDVHSRGADRSTGFLFGIWRTF